MEPYPVKRIYGLEAERRQFTGDYRQRETELLTRLKGKKTPIGQDRVGVLREEELIWNDSEKVWIKEIRIKLDPPRRGRNGPKPIDPYNLDFKIRATGRKEEKCLEKAWLYITNAFHARMNPKAPQPKPAH